MKMAYNEYILPSAAHKEAAVAGWFPIHTLLGDRTATNRHPWRLQAFLNSIFCLARRVVAQKSSRHIARKIHGDVSKWS